MKKLPKKFQDPKFNAAVSEFRKAESAQQRYNNIVENSLKKYGDHGPLISGIVRDHFPANVKNQLRALRDKINTHTDAGFANRPPRVHMNTMRSLHKAVQSGFTKRNPARKKTARKKTARKKKNPAFATGKSVKKTRARKTLGAGNFLVFRLNGNRFYWFKGLGAKGASFGTSKIGALRLPKTKAFDMATFLERRSPAGAGTFGAADAGLSRAEIMREISGKG